MVRGDCTHAQCQDYAVAIKVEANRPAEASDRRPGRNGNSRKKSDSSTTTSTTQKGNLPVRDRRAATFLHFSVADRCPVCKASACPDVRKANNGQRRKLARKALICYKFRTLSELYIKI
ncbi:Serine/threonine-protein kinase [Trichinella spiralis]|uniref:Serine/threonine-protein kinase n=1 Tax=Trichinella spiralis TaxID=6334 RepID=A0ABR3KTX1_TRISP